MPRAGSRPSSRPARSGHVGSSRRAKLETMNSLIGRPRRRMTGDDAAPGPNGGTPGRAQARWFRRPMAEDEANRTAMRFQVSGKGARQCGLADAGRPDQFDDHARPFPARAHRASHTARRAAESTASTGHSAGMHTIVAPGKVSRSSAAVRTGMTARSIVGWRIAINSGAAISLMTISGESCRATHKPRLRTGAAQPARGEGGRAMVRRCSR